MGPMHRRALLGGFSSAALAAAGLIAAPGALEAALLRVEPLGDPNTGAPVEKAQAVVVVPRRRRRRRVCWWRRGRRVCAWR
ncbi:hypothetical protein [Methylobacterium sp. NEAU K]|uniref:hypothetical protein n=1 Tax=Methylobacterium sp. NEAU K TaxID=3064946 RepID=UPI002734A8BE|nr:hypothetical protein [Methylobacterium sp. NEAU K]MDP4003261.1 hypothetical protein [Methylobacterium sp. NEAU K]